MIIQKLDHHKKLGEIRFETPVKIFAWFYMQKIRKCRLWSTKPCLIVKNHVIFNKLSTLQNYMVHDEGWAKFENTNTPVNYWIRNFKCGFRLTMLIGHFSNFYSVIDLLCRRDAVFRFFRLQFLRFRVFICQSHPAIVVEIRWPTVEWQLSKNKFLSRWDPRPS